MTLFEHNERIDRALKQRMYLISAEMISDREWIFMVEGSTGTNYKVKFGESMSCMCIDFKKRKKICKHIMFIIGRVLNNRQLLNDLDSDPNVCICENFKTFSQDLIKKLGKRSDIKDPDPLVDSGLSGFKEDDMCTICFEGFSAKESITKCTICTNLFHKACIDLWLSKKTMGTCPLCRSTWSVEKTSNISEDVLSKLGSLKL
jgi:hypothetical protein